MGSGPEVAQFFYIHVGGSWGEARDLMGGSRQSASATSALGGPALGRAVGLPDRHPNRVAQARGPRKSVRGGTRALAPAPLSNSGFNWYHSLANRESASFVEDRL